MSVLVLAFIAALVVAWLLLRYREDRQVFAGKPRLSALQLVFAALGAGTVLFSGGCGLVLGIGEAMRTKSGSADDFMGVELVIIFALPPLLVGAFIWFLSTRRRKS